MDGFRPIGPCVARCRDRKLAGTGRRMQGRPYRLASVGDSRSGDQDEDAEKEDGKAFAHTRGPTRRSSLLVAGQRPGLWWFHWGSNLRGVYGHAALGPAGRHVSSDHHVRRSAAISS